MAKIRKIYDQTIKPDGTKVTIYPITSTRAVYTPEGVTLDKYIQDGYFHGADLAGYKVVYELSELPLTETPFGYLMDSNLYVWVGTNGDTLGGKYQNCGPFRGPKGDPGATVEGNGEDIDTNEQNKLQFANRSNTDGMGYVILRKDVSLTDQITDSSTIYEIRYDFDLDGETLSMPSACALKFIGGCFRNGAIVLNNTEIINGCFHSISLSGAATNRELHTDWFNITNSSDDLVYNNASITALFTLANSMANGCSLIVDRDIAISEPIQVKTFSLVCKGKINFYSLPTNGAAIVVDYGGGNSNRLYLHHIIDCYYRSLVPGITLEALIALGIAGVKILKSDPVNTTFTIKNISNFTVGLWLAPKGNNQVAADFLDVNIQNSYIGIKFDKGVGWTNFNTFHSGTITNYSNFAAYGENIGVAFIYTASDHPYAANQFNNLSVDGAKIGIYTEAYIAASVFNNLRCEAVTTLISEASQITYNTNKSIVIVDSDSRITAASNLPYKTFIVKTKQDYEQSEHEYTIRAIGKISGSLSYASCNLPLVRYTADIGADVSPKFMVSQNSSSGVGYSITNGKLTFASLCPCIVLNVTNIKNLLYRFVVKRDTNADAEEAYRAYVIAANENFEKVTLSSGFDFTNTTSTSISSYGARGASVATNSGYSQFDICFGGLSDSIKYLIISFPGAISSVWVKSLLLGNDTIVNMNQSRIDAPAAPTAQCNNGYYENIFRTDLNKPVWYTENGWVDSTGADPDSI